jgi:hypothetical protein
MIAKRILDTTLTIEDFQILRSKNIDNVIFNIIKNKFEGICYVKCYILNVLRLINIGDIESNQNDVQNCSFNVNVLFEIECEFFQTLEPILDMKILSIRNNSITLGSKNKIAVLKPGSEEKISDLTNGFKEGDYYPVRAGRAIFEPVSNKIKIGCVSYHTPLYKDLLSLDVSNKFISKYYLNNEIMNETTVEKIFFEINQDLALNTFMSVDKEEFIKKLQPWFVESKNSNLLEDLKNNKILNMSNKEIIIVVDKSNLANVTYSISRESDKNKEGIDPLNYDSLFQLISEVYIFYNQINNFNDENLYSKNKTKIILQNYLSSL